MRLLTARQIEDHAALSAWWESAQRNWNSNKSKSDNSDLLDRINFHGQLGAQIPAVRHRVMYSASGNSLVAARLEGSAGIIEHKLYWAAVSGVEEARFLTAILNSAMVLERVKPLQALGLFGTRDFDKNVFSVAIPSYDRTSAHHQRLAALADEAETLAASVALDPTWRFQRSRRAVRDALNVSDVRRKIEETVDAVIPPISG